jgi:hypothetical protein
MDKDLLKRSVVQAAIGVGIGIGVAYIAIQMKVSEPVFFCMLFAGMVAYVYFSAKAEKKASETERQ